MTPRRVVVVGGGISGLAAAWALTGGAEHRQRRCRRRGARGIVAPRRPVAQRCARRVAPSTWGPTVSSGGGPRRSSSAAKWGSPTRWCRSGPGARPCGPGGASAPSPRGTRWASPPGSGRPLAAASSACAGLVGLARDAVLPRPDVRGPIGDRSIGPLVARKLGHQVVDVLVDPLIGGIHAGSVDDMSAAATFPALLAAAQRRGGLMRALRAEVPAPDPDGPPLFWSLEGGMASLVHALASGLGERGVDVRLSAPAGRLERTDGGWTVWSDGQPGRGRRRRAGRARTGHGHALASPRRRGGGPAPGDRLRLGRRWPRSASGSTTSRHPCTERVSWCPVEAPTRAATPGR